MRLVLVKVLLLLVCAQASKRSPLQVGLVTFTEKPHHAYNVTYKTGISPSITGAHTHKWIPGHVRHRAYIPAHLQHFYVPTHDAVLQRTLLLPSPYRQSVGGFGIGADRGGQGAGHGYQVHF